MGHRTLELPPAVPGGYLGLACRPTGDLISNNVFPMLIHPGDIFAEFCVFQLQPRFVSTVKIQSLLVCVKLHWSSRGQRNGTLPQAECGAGISAKLIFFTF